MTVYKQLKGKGAKGLKARQSIAYGNAIRKWTCTNSKPQRGVINHIVNDKQITPFQGLRVCGYYSSHRVLPCANDLWLSAISKQMNRCKMNNLVIGRSAATKQFLTKERISFIINYSLLIVNYLRPPVHLSTITNHSSHKRGRNNGDLFTCLPVHLFTNINSKLHFFKLI